MFVCAFCGWHQGILLGKLTNRAMTNDLKNFLEEEIKTFDKKVYEIDDYGGRFYPLENIEIWIKDHDTHLIKHVLDLVEKEVEKKREEYLIMKRQTPFQDTLFNHAVNVLKKVSTIINNLRV